MSHKFSENRLTDVTSMKNNVFMSEPNFLSDLKHLSSSTKKSDFERANSFKSQQTCPKYEFEDIFFKGAGDNIVFKSDTAKPLSNYDTYKSMNYFCESQNKENISTYRMQNTKLKKCPPKELCSYRLLPTRHQTKNAILSILNDGEVCIEFLKKRSYLKEEIVCEVCRISPDGKRIILYEPDGGNVSPSNKPPPLPTQGTDHIYGLENLPEKHWKKYTYATKFVELIKAKTPKITYYTEKAKCLLMENASDFEASFYGGKCFQL